MSKPKKMFDYAIRTYRVKPKEVYGENWQISVRKMAMSIPVYTAHIHVSLGNDKIGNIFNFNLPAIVTCPKCAHTTCGKNGCYALKDERYLGCVVARWENLGLLLRDLNKVEMEIVAFLTEEIRKNNKRKVKKVLRMRIHESGDFAVAGLEQEYLDMWLRIMKRFPEVRFYAYTKCYDLVRENAERILAQKNFNLILSDWDGLEIPKDLVAMGFSIAYVDDGSEHAKRVIPASAFRCPATAGNEFTCEHCGKCSEHGCSVVFKKH